MRQIGLHSLRTYNYFSSRSQATKSYCFNETFFIIIILGFEWSYSCLLPSKTSWTKNGVKQCLRQLLTTLSSKGPCYSGLLQLTCVLVGISKDCGVGARGFLIELSIIAE